MYKKGKFDQTCAGRKFIYLQNASVTKTSETWFDVATNFQIWQANVWKWKETKCYMTNLGTWNGHVSKAKIQMWSIVFPGVPTD